MKGPTDWSRCKEALVGDVPEAAAVLDEATRWLGRPPEDDPRLAGRVHLSRGLMASIRGDLHASRTAHQSAAMHFRQSGDERSALSAMIRASEGV